MPEDQKPFVHQDGTATPTAAASPGELLRPARLKRLAHEMAFVAQADLTAGQRLTADVAGEILDLLQDPSLNTTMTALVALEPGDRALVSDVATMLLTAGNRRHRVVVELRALLEKLS